MELFFDLVFIFTTTQLAHYLIAHPDWRGAARTALLLALVWFVWVYTAWVTNWLRPDQAPVRAMLIALMLGSLLLSAAIPEAFAGAGLLFALVYAAVQVGRTLFSLWAVQGQPWLVDGFQKTSAVVRRDVAARGARRPWSAGPSRRRCGRRRS